MGYNKHFINNTFVFADYSPVGRAAAKVLGQRPLGNGYSSCATSIASYPWGANGVSGHQDQWWNNTCIAASHSNFFTWYECNASAPTDGTIPFPMLNNVYYSSDGGYQMNCKSTIWNLTEAQAVGVDVGSSTFLLPTAEELTAMGHDVLQF